MKIAFLILAHKNPNQLTQLVEQLSHTETEIYIHIDKKSDLSIFKNEFNRANIHPKLLVQKVDIIYSSITYIDATYYLIKKAKYDGCDYFVLLSGLDLPLRPVDEIVSFFKKQRNTDFFDYIEMPNKNLVYSGKTRTEYYNFKIRKKMETLFPPKEIQHQMSWKGKLLNWFLLFKSRGKTKREFPLGMTPYYSSQWWCMSLKSITYIIEFLEKNPEYYDYHKKALHPEEMFFQSIILNSERKINVVNDNKRYIRWKEGKKHPELIGLDELNEIRKVSNDLFARKFDLKY